MRFGWDLNGVNYWLASAVYKMSWRRKFFHGWRRSVRNWIASSSRTERRHTWQRLCWNDWTPTWTFGSKNFDLHTHQMWNPSTSACGRKLRKNHTRHTTATQMSSKLLLAAHDGRWGKSSTLNNLMPLGVNISICYKNCLITLKITICYRYLKFTKQKRNRASANTGITSPRLSVTFGVLIRSILN